MELPTEKILNMNTSYEPQYIPAQGHQERIILFQHMKPKPKAGKRTKKF